MPNVSRAQQAFFALSRSSEGRAKLRASGKQPVPQGVANEWLKADKRLKGLPKHVHNRGPVRGK